MSVSTARRFCVVPLACVLLSSALCQAQTPAQAAPPAPPPPAAPQASAIPAGTNTVEEARLHYERGVQLYSESDFAGALVEIERAYALAPSYKILYNMGRIQRRLNNYAAALTAFERYLSEGVDVPEERRQEVQREIDTLKPRVAVIELKLNIRDADLSVDDVPVTGRADTDSRMVTVNPGRHKVSASKSGFYPISQFVTIVSGDAVRVPVELKKISADAPVEEKIDHGPRNRAIIGWSVTGALAVGAGVMGILAISEKNTLRDDRGTLNIAPSKLDSDANKTKSYSIVADSLTAGAIIAGGVSIYLTTIALKHDPAPVTGVAPVPTVRVSVGPTSVGLNGTF